MQTAAVSGKAWGTRPITALEAQTFAVNLGVSSIDRDNVARTLYEFQPDGMVRGMFFVSLRAAIAKVVGEEAVRALQQDNRIGERFIPFSLYPHRDFYRFWFAGIAKAFPGRPISEGIERIARTFFPVFLESAAGRTMAALLLGSDPLNIVRRLRDAYSMSVPHNQHTLEELSGRHLRWTAIAEPGVFYRDAFTGIMRGTMDSQRAPMPSVSIEHKGAHGAHHQHIVFDLRW